MKNVVVFFLMIGISVFLTGCFEIREEVTVKPDGSGSITMTLDMSESKYNLANFMKAGEVQGERIPSKEEIEEQLKEVEQKLRNMQGLSDIRQNKDFENFIFSISANFSNIKYLNEAINTFVKKVNENVSPPVRLVDNFRFNSGSFQRLFNYPVETVTEEEYKKLGTMERFMLESARLVQIYRFEKPVKTISNARAQLSASKKSVKIEHKLSDLVKGSSTVASDLQF
jgi:RNase H-fold protein (predicted Holliday junction resolvase)